jgi:Zn-dependent peptidase ImmA (M78 family)
METLIWSFGALTASKRNTRKIPTKQRLHQIHRYLCQRYKIKVRLRVEKLPKKWNCLGIISYENPDLPPLIRIDKNLSRSESISTLLHEFAHAISHKRHGCEKRERDMDAPGTEITMDMMKNLQSFKTS